MAPVFAVSPLMGMITLVVLLVVILGGIGSMTGAIVAGLVLGLVLASASTLSAAGWRRYSFLSLSALSSSSNREASLDSPMKI